MQTKPATTQCLKVALTGGIATGKSSVAGWFAEQGVPVIDTDKVVHELLNQDEPLRDWLRNTFSEAIFNDDLKKTVKRKALGQQVFANAALRQQLEAQLHPRVRQQVASFFKQQAAAPFAIPLAIAEVPLLFETGHTALYDELWLVYAPETLQKQRLMQERGLSEAEAEARLRSQMPIESKRALAHTVIENQGDFLMDTVAQLRLLLSKALQG